MRPSLPATALVLVALLLAPASASRAMCPETLGTPPCDPIAPDHPLWAIPPGSATIDGALEAAWQNALVIERSQAWRSDGPIRIRAMWSAQGLYLATEVADANALADGNGGGSGQRYDVQHDDSVAFFFDPNESREEVIQDGDRAFGVNLGAMGDPLTGGGKVRRWYYVKGTGNLAVNFGLFDALPGGDPPVGALWASSISGTVNNGADRDTGWVNEIFLPWNALNMSAPAHGTTIGMNFDVIFDNNGGIRDFVDNRNDCNSAVTRIQTPAFVDDHVQGAHSSYSGSQSGIHGPVDYAVAMFVDPAASAKPAAIADLAASGASAFGARLTFSAPTGTVGGAGSASSYEIRYATTPITNNTAWNAATPLANTYVPRLAGLPETLRIAGLSPSTSYHVAVRARDAVDHLGDLSNDATVTTTGSASAGDRGRIIPSPDAPTLIFENGDPFSVIGEHVGLSWPYFRNLYPGDVWSGFGSTFYNFHDAPSFEGTAGPHFANLETKGVKVLRVFLENLGQNFGAPSPPAMPIGRYWIEYPKGVYNESMHGFLENALAEAAAHDMYLILSPHETFPWDEVFTQETPYYSGNCGPNGCGPLGDINDFYQNPGIYAIVQARLAKVVEWVKNSPNRDRVLGWEGVNEWDSVEWTWNCFPVCEPGSETEMRLRAQFMHLIDDYLRKSDPDRLVLSSTTVRDPRGPVARALFYDRSLDVLAPHYYTNSSEEPFNNPDANKSVRPAFESGLLSSYWTTHRSDARPLLNGEWGLTSFKCGGGTVGYGGSFTQPVDEAIYRTVTWSGLAGGQAGAGLRITSYELAGGAVGQRNELTPAMRDVETAISAFLSWDRFDLAHFAAHTLLGKIAATSASQKTLLAWGTSDGSQGIAYVLQDDNPPHPAAGTVSDGELQIQGITPGGPYIVEFWHPGSGAAALASLSITVASGGVLQVAMPPFTGDIAVRFAPEPDTAASLAIACAALATIYVRGASRTVRSA